MHHNIYFVSYISPISAYVIDPPARLKSGQVLKGHEREQKESNKIEVGILLEIKSKQIWIKFEYKNKNNKRLYEWRSRRVRGFSWLDSCFDVIVRNIGRMWGMLRNNNKNHHTLSSSLCQIIPCQIHYQVAQKSSPPTSLPYHIGNPIFFKDSLILYTFVNFIDSDDYNSAQWRERVPSQPNFSSYSLTLGASFKMIWSCSSITHIQMG